MPDKALPDIPADTAKAALPLLVLSVLADGPRYGYALRRRLDHLVGLDLPWARMYPLLHALERHGLIAATWETTTGRRRKWYTLTDAGHRRLVKDTAAWSAAIARAEAVVLPAVRRSAARRASVDSAPPG